MGCDIHWIIERKHSDGCWEAVHSQSLYFDQFNWSAPNPDEMLSDPRFIFGARRYAWFAVLSSVRDELEDERHGTIATLGIPYDASEYAKLNFGEEDEDRHSQGSFTLDELKWAVRDQPEGLFLEQEEHIAATERLQALMGILGRDDLVSEIIFGRARTDDEEVPHPDMASESNHERLARHRRSQGLLPIAPETVRVIVAYDN